MSKKSIDSAPIPFLTEVNEFNTEKKDLENIAVLSDSDSSEQNIVYKHEANLVRGLNQRCLSMITVTGIFGTGLVCIIYFSNFLFTNKSFF